MNVKRQIILVILYSLSLPLLVAIDFTFDITGVYSQSSAMIMSGMLFLIQILIPYAVLMRMAGNAFRKPLIACLVWTFAIIMEPMYGRYIGDIAEDIVSIIMPQIEWGDSSHRNVIGMVDIVFMYFYCAIALVLAVVVSQKNKCQ